jgi:hypothetical protein
MAVVLERFGTGPVFPLPLGRPVRIGRWQQGEVVLEDRHVSRRLFTGRHEAQGEVDELQALVDTRVHTARTNERARVCMRAAS